MTYVAIGIKVLMDEEEEVDKVYYKAINLILLELMLQVSGSLPW
jgi:hypothetical protein